MKKKHKRPLKQRFIALYLTLVLAPAVILSTLFVRTAFRYFEETAQFTSRSSFQQTGQLLEYFITDVNDGINALLSSAEFHRILEKDNSAAGYREQIDDMLYLREQLNNCQSKDEISSVLLYLDNEAVYIGEMSQVRPLSLVRGESWFSYVEDSYPGSAMIPSSYLENADAIGYAKTIRHSRSYLRTIGLLFVRLNRNVLTSYLNNAGAAHVSIINEHDELIAENSGNRIRIPVSVLKDNADGESHRIQYGGGTYYLFAKKIENTDWYFSYLEPYETMLHLLTTQGMSYLIVFLLLLILGLAFFYLCFQHYINRVTALTNHMSNIREKLPPLMNVGGQGDEIDDLVQSYNYMLTRVQELLKRQYELGNQIKESEMKALYEQINPHFLYNTLTMINWLAEDGQTETVTGVITALSAFYRLCLNKGNENIYLKEELEIIRNFIYIQRLRFGTDICLNCEIDPIYENFVLPKLTLQPLVENALVHGILMRRDKSGTIFVSVSDRAGFLRITVADTGVGMPQETVEKLNAGTLRSSGSHYGVWNVLQRVSLYYDAECTLIYESEEGTGTSATLTLPYRPAWEHSGTDAQQQESP